MEKFIPYEKLSKKQKQALNSLRRKNWGELSPVTRRAENPKAYKRKRTRIDFSEDDPRSFCRAGRGAPPAEAWGNAASRRFLLKPGEGCGKVKP